MSLHDEIVPPLTKMLGNLDAWLGLAIENAASRSFDPAVLLSARLAPDQFALLRQVQSACDAAKFAAARTAGKAPPRNPDTEQTLAELRARIAATRDYLATLTAADFAGAEERLVPLSFMPGKAMLAGDYLREFALPNFYFHLVTAYAILRHSGVPLGKIPYIGGLTLRDAP